MSSGSKGGNSGGKGGNSGGKGGKAGLKIGESVEKIVGYQRIFNCTQSPNKKTDWTIEHAIKNKIIKNTFPKSIDLREDNWWKIADQKDTGSCIGWSSTDSLLRWHQVKKGNLKKGKKLSVRYTWMAAKETDEFNDKAETFLESGETNLKGALNVLKKWGCVKESILPFDGSMVDSKWTQKMFYEEANKMKIKGYYSVIKEFKVKVEHLRIWIGNIGPVMVLSDIDENFKNCGKKGKLDFYDNTKIIASHSFALVGYNSEGFIIRNSWGKKWGKKGYAFASNKYIENALCEGYGIMV